MYMSLRNTKVLQPTRLHNILQRDTSSLITLTLRFLTARFPITNGTLNRAHLCKRRIIRIGLSINPDPIIRIRRLEKGGDVRLRSGIAIRVLARRAHDIRTRLGPQVDARAKFLTARGRAGDRDAVAVDETDVTIGLIGIEGAFELRVAALGVCFRADEYGATRGVVREASSVRTFSGRCTPWGL